MKKASDSWTRDITFQPERGNILDANGSILAENVSAPSVVVVPKQVKNPQKTSEQLASILDMSIDTAYEYVTKDKSQVRIHPEGRKISKQQEKKLRTLNLNGIYLAKDSKRSYPNGKALSHVLGFTGIDNQGLMGLERYYDDKLKGKEGSLSFYSDAKGNKLAHLADEYHSPKDGLNLKTTINSE